MKQQIPVYNKHMNNYQQISNDTTYGLSCYQFYDYQIKHLTQQQGDYQNYKWILILRLCIILASSIALIINIAVIVKRKQYKFNTIRLFMFVQIFYVISLLSVVTHHASYNSFEYNGSKQQLLGSIEWMITLVPMKQVKIGEAQTEVRANTRMNYYNCLAKTNNIYPSAIEGIVNLCCYALSYWLAVCITLYVKDVVQNNAKKFMRRRGTLIFLVSLGIIIWYLVPFIMSFLQGVPFSFGPTGYKFKSTSQLFFYGGLVNRSGGQGYQGTVLVIVWMLLLALILFAYHIYLLCSNRRAIKEMLQLDQLNPRQLFIIRSGRLSIVIFIVQILNVGKLIFSIVLSLPQFQDDKDSVAFYILLIVNVLYDLMAFILIFIYAKYYYRQGRNLQQRSEIMSSTLVSSFSSPAI